MGGTRDVTEEMESAGVDPHDDERLRLWFLEQFEETEIKYFVTYPHR